MAILSIQEIQKLVEEQNLISYQEDVGDVSSHFQPNGYDLSIEGVSYLLEPGKLQVNGKKLSRDYPFPLNSMMTADERMWHLHPGAYLIRFREVINLPPDVMAYLHPRSSLLRMGATIHAAVWDAGYQGAGQSLLQVMNSGGIWIEPGARVAQMTFHRLSESASETYSGSYQGEGLNPKNVEYIDPQTEQVVGKATVWPASSAPSSEGS